MENRPARTGVTAERSPIAGRPTRRRFRDRAASILILEMDEAAARFLTQVVQGLGLRVIGPVGTEEAAVALAWCDPPDIVLAEIELGKGSSGISVVRRVLERAPETAIIYVTDHIDRLAAHDLGNVTVVEKPVDRNELEYAIRAATLRR